jgi:hypothetical protein
VTAKQHRIKDRYEAAVFFGDPWAAEAFRTIEGLGQEWEVIGRDLLEVIELLETSAANGIRYVEFDPPSKLIRGEKNLVWSRYAASLTTS